MLQIDSATSDKSSTNLAELHAVVNKGGPLPRCEWKLSSATKSKEWNKRSL